MPPKRSVAPRRGPGKPGKNKAQSISKATAPKKGSKATVLKSSKNKGASKAPKAKQDAVVSKATPSKNTCFKCRESFSSVVLFKRHQLICGVEEKIESEQREKINERLQLQLVQALEEKNSLAQELERTRKLMEDPEGKKKRVRNDDETSFQRKKSKRSNSVSEDINIIENQEEEDVENTVPGEVLNYQTIREGMLIFGCVIEIRSTFFVMSLPGCITGIVPVDSISNAFTESLQKASTSANKEAPAISSIIQTGMVFPCKVMLINKGTAGKAYSIILSINPRDINSKLWPSSLYPKMVLYVAVRSVEDHGYVVDTGNNYIQGFLPQTECKENFKDFTIGEVIPTYIKSINFSKIHADIQLSKMDFRDDYPEISVRDIKLSSILPGAQIKADVIDVKHPFVFMKYLGFDVCANMLSVGSISKTVEIGTTIQGTVIYTHPITNVIYIMLNQKPAPYIFNEYFQLEKYDFVQNLKFQYFYKGVAFYKISEGTYGFINNRDLPKTSSESVNHLISKACVLFFHYMDNLVQMTADPSLTEINMIKHRDIKIGTICGAFVQKHAEDGMIVQICPGLIGFVRRIDMSDAYVTRPESLHPIGKKIMCRVLSLKDGKSLLKLTCKESLIVLQDEFILSSYDKIQEGQFYVGVVVQVTDKYILVRFFGNIKGVVPSSCIPSRSVYFEGQTVLCKVLNCNPFQRKLRLSLKTDKCSVEQLCDPYFISIAESFDIKVPKPCSSNSKSVIKSSSHLLCKESCKVPDPDSDSDSDWDYVPPNCPYKAEILKVKGSQLDVLVDERWKGRVHITQLGCKTEGVYPLREFSAGKKITVFFSGEYIQKKQNYLNITHKNSVTFKEFSLSIIDPFPSDFTEGTLVRGFVKEVCPFFVILWISPTETGQLEYLHYTESAKQARKLRRLLKIGVSVHAFVLNNDFETGKASSVPLRKIPNNLPRVGKKVLGLVQTTCQSTGVTLKLPFGYYGDVAVTDITDKYDSLPSLLESYKNLKFVLCHVLDVNHQTKKCQLSLRKSRVYGKESNMSDSFCSEMTHETITEGAITKGFITAISDAAITVVLGRDLEGKVPLHDCAEPNCALCDSAQSLRLKYTIGDVIVVMVNKVATDGQSNVLAVTDYVSVEKSKFDRLLLTEDISWDNIK